MSMEDLVEKIAHVLLYTVMLGVIGSVGWYGRVVKAMGMTILTSFYVYEYPNAFSF